MPPVPNSLSALDPETVFPLPQSEVIVHFNRSDFLRARLGGVGGGGAFAGSTVLMGVDSVKRASWTDGVQSASLGEAVSRHKRLPPYSAES